MFRDGSRIHDQPIVSIWTVVSGLAIVLGLFLLMAWLFKRGMPQVAAALPREVVETLGRTTIAPRQTVHLLRIGQKLLLVSISATGVETLTEITDPLEVDRLAGICNQSSPHSASSAFRHVFQQFSREPAKGGFVGEAARSNTELASGELATEVTSA